MSKVQIVFTLRAVSDDPVDTVESGEKFCQWLKEFLTEDTDEFQVRATVEHTVSLID